MHKPAIWRALCLALLASATAQAQTVAAGARAVVSSDTLAVYAAMSETAEVKATLAKGDTVVIGLVLFGENVTWCAVSKVGQSRRLGFASCEFLEPDRGPTAAVEAAPSPTPVPAQPPVAKSKPKPITIREVPQAPITVREVPSPAFPKPVELTTPKPATMPSAATVAVGEPVPAAPPPVTPAVPDPTPAAPAPPPVTAREPEPPPAPASPPAAPAAIRESAPGAPTPAPVTAREPEPTVTTPPSKVAVRESAPTTPPPVTPAVPDPEPAAPAPPPVTAREPEPTVTTPLPKVVVRESAPTTPPPVTPAVPHPAPAAPTPPPVTAREPEPTVTTPPSKVAVRESAPTTPPPVTPAVPHPAPAAPAPPPVTFREPEPTVTTPPPNVGVRESAPATPPPLTAEARVTIREPEPTPPPVPVREPATPAPLVRAPEAPAPSPVDFVEVLLDGSGLRSSLANYTRNTNLLSFLDKGRLAEIELPTLQHALSRWFKPAAFYAAIGHQVRKNYAPERLPDVVEWLRSPVTTKLTALERRAFSPDARDELVAFADGLRAAPPSQPRLVLVHRLYESLRTCDMEVETTIALVHTVAQAIGPALPKEKRYSAAELDRALGAVKSRYRSIMKNARIVNYLFAYRSVSDEELEQYVTFLESANGKWLISLVDKGFFDATESISRGLRADIPRNVKPKRGLPGENTAKGLLP